MKADTTNTPIFPITSRQLYRKVAMRLEKIRYWFIIQIENTLK